MKSPHPFFPRSWRWPVATAAVAVLMTSLLRLEKKQTPSLSPEVETKTVSAEVPTRPATNSVTSPGQVLNRATPEELSAALQRRLAGGASPDEIQATLAFLAQTQPALAGDLALRLGRTETEKYRWAVAVLDRWALANPAEAWKWTLQSRHSSAVSSQPPLHAVVLNRVAMRDPDQIIDWIRAVLRGDKASAHLSSTALADSAISALMQGERGDDARRAIEQWAAEHGAKKLGNATIEAVALRFAQQRSPEAAAQWLQTLPVSEWRNFALGAMAEQMAMANPPAAMDWALRLTEADGQARTLQLAFNAWVGHDTLAATRWLADHESNSSVDQLIVNLVRYSALRDSNPRVAVTWAESVSDVSLRQQTLESAVLAWGSQEQARAAHYVAESPQLSDEQKTRLIKQLKEGKPPIP